MTEVVHWDDVEPWDVPEAVRPLGGLWQSLGDAAGSIGVGCKRVRVPEGLLLTPPHVHSAEEEIFHVLSGNATLWQGGTTCPVGAGDTIVHVAGGDPHTLIGGDGGFEVLIFGHRKTAEVSRLPRTGYGFAGGEVIHVLDDRPWRSEGPLGLPEGEPGERPANVRALEDAPNEYGGIVRFLAEGLTKHSGLNRIALPPNEEGSPPHCHSTEEEVFVFLDGEGTFELWSPPDPENPQATEPAERLPVRRGDVVARPPGTRISHAIRSGPAGLTYVVYGTREPNDICWYPRSNKIFFRGVGVIGRLELLAYGDGEPS